MASYTERYIAAAMRTAPEDNRGDLRAELQASIDDAIEARTENGEDHATAERAVLTELGDPDRLAARYADRGLHLIGPEYYLDWLRLLKLLLWIVLPIATLGVVLGRVLSGANPGDLIATGVTVIVIVAVQVFFWTTLLFVILERTGARAHTTRWSVDRLRDDRPQGSVELSDLVATIVFVTIMIGAVLWDRFVGFVQSDGQVVSVLNAGLWPAWIGILLAILAAETVFAIVLYRRRWWTPALALTNAVVAIAAAGVGLILLWTGTLLNAALFDVVAPGDPASVQQAVTISIGASFVIVAVWDIVDGVIKTVRRAVADPGSPANRAAVTREQTMNRPSRSL
jgi:hypothetical protein